MISISYTKEMRVLVQLLIFFNLIFTAASSWGTTHIGLALGLVQDQRSTSSKDSLQNTLVEGYLFTPLFKTKSFFLGVEYLLITTSAPNGADENTATMTATNPMAAFKLHLSKGLLSVTVMGSPSVQANYSVSSGVANDLWTGTSYAAKLTLHPNLSTSWKICASLMYFGASYTSKSSTSTSSISSFSRTLIIPTLGVEVYF